MRISEKQQEAERLRRDASLRREQIAQKEQNELKRYADAADDTGMQNVQREIDHLLGEAAVLERAAEAADNDLRKLENEVETIQKAIASHQTNLAAHQEQARIAQGHVNSIQQEITRLNARIEAIS